MIGRQTFLRVDRRAKRIHPGMQLEPAGVRFGDRKFQRIVARRNARFPAQEFRPRFCCDA